MALPVKYDVNYMVTREVESDSVIQHPPMSITVHTQHTDPAEAESFAFDYLESRLVEPFNIEHTDTKGSIRDY